MGFSVKKNIKNLWELKYVGRIAVIGSLCSIGSFFTGIFTGNTIILAVGYTVFAISLSAITFYEMHHRRNCEIGTRNRDRMHKKEKDKIKKQLGSYVKVTKKKLAEAARLLGIYQGKSYEFHFVFHHLREANALLMIPSDFTDDRHARFKGCIENCISQLAEFLSALTEKPCALCIKLLEESESPVKVFTFARNIKSQGRCADDETIYELQKNTAFSNIWNFPDAPWFYSENLTEERGYRNQNASWERNHHYLTTAVLPIQAPKESAGGEKYQGIKGFLCLDSAEAEAFPEKPIVNILACLADILYITLMQYRTVSQSEG